MTFKEWLEATYISSEDYCGEDLSHYDSILDLTDTKMKNHNCIQWLSHMMKPRIVCKDGFSMSCQGGFGSYSKPKKTVCYYEQMEVGFPSQREELLGDYIGDVYGYIDVEILEQIIEKHGGIDDSKSLTPEQNQKLRMKKLKRIV